MKDFYTSYGYMGFIPDENKWRLFESETAYFEYVTQ